MSKKSTKEKTKIKSMKPKLLKTLNMSQLEFKKWTKIPHHGQSLILSQLPCFEFTTLAIWT